MNKKIRVIISWSAVVVCAGIIFYLSHQVATESQALSDRFAFLLRLPFGSFIVRKGAHFLEFAGLCTLICNALYQTFGRLRPIYSVIFTAIYAASDEIHQIFIEGRACRLFDWFVDCGGAVCAVIFICLVSAIFRKINRRSLR